MAGYEKIREGIYRVPVTLPNSPLKELNSYVIKGNDTSERNLIIDLGFRQDICRNMLKSALAELDIDMEKTDIFLTHLHSDHTGLLPDIAVPGSRVYVSDYDRDWLTGDTRLELEMLEYARYERAGVPQRMMEHFYDTHPGHKFAPDPDFRDYTSAKQGDIISAGEYRFEVIETPGHTPGHLCLWNEEHGILFCGDHVLFDITPNISNWPKTDNSLKKYLDSLRMIREFPVKCALPAHRAEGNFVERIEDLLVHHEKRLDECLNIVKNNPGLNPYEIAERMTWRIRAKNWEDFPDSQKWFAVSECLAHLDYLVAEGKITESEKFGKYYHI